MSTRVFLRVLALYYVVALGAVWLIAPRSGLGQDHSPYAIFVARALGTDLVVVGILNWLISSQSGKLIRGTLWANLLLNLVPVIMGTVSVLNGSFTGRGWVGVGAHAIPLLAVVYYLITTPSARQVEAGHVADLGTTVP